MDYSSNLLLISEQLSHIDFLLQALFVLIIFSLSIYFTILFCKLCYSYLHNFMWW